MRGVYGALTNHRLNDYRLGRMVRRLLEMETYRMMALVCLPLAQQVTKEVVAFEQDLDTLSERTAQLCKGDAQHLLHDIAQLSSRVMHSEGCRGPFNHCDCLLPYQLAEAALPRYRDLRSQCSCWLGNRGRGNMHCGYAVPREAQSPPGTYLKP